MFSYNRDLNKTFRKTRVALLFGGRSGEHEISVRSAESVKRALDPAKYDVLEFQISKDGKWKPRPFVPEPNANPDIDVVFPVLHGTFGEDGTVQGLLELAELPYVGAGVLASAASMDKVIAKRLCREAGLPVVPYLVLHRGDFDAESLRLPFDFPVFVKPANLGSSVGITKVKCACDLPAALATACQFDRKILVELGITGREFECAVLGGDPPCASTPCEVLPSQDFYTYEDKYLLNEARINLPAQLSASQVAQMQRLAVAGFNAVDCEGMARVDFLMDGATGEFFLNEINTIPGFTSISMYPKMWGVFRHSLSAAPRSINYPGVRSRGSAPANAVFAMRAGWCIWIVLLAGVSAGQQSTPGQANPAAKPANPAEDLDPALRRFVDVLSTVQSEGAETQPVDKLVYEGAIPSMLRQLDPHTQFFDPAQFQQLKQMEDSEQKGFGSIVSVLPGQVIFLQTLPGTPSNKAGIQAGDELVAVNNIAIRSLEPQQIIQLLTEARQQRVAVYVRRQGSARPLEFRLTPELVDAPSVDRAYVLERGIGYIRLASWDLQTARQLTDAIAKLGGSSLTGLVVDLRNNPGGVVKASLDAAAMFLTPGAADSHGKRPD